MACGSAGIHTKHMKAEGGGRGWGRRDKVDKDRKGVAHRKYLDT